MISKIFAMPIFHYHVDIPETLIPRIHAMMEFDKEGRKYSNQGGWQSHDIEHDPHFVDVINIIKGCIADAYPKFYPSIETSAKDLQVLSTWINVNRGDNWNSPHVHPAAHLAGCFYVKVNENSGPIVFHNPLKELIHHYDISMSDTVESDTLKLFEKYKPVSGELILFPAWLFHHVEESNDEEERISIAFNTILR